MTYDALKLSDRQILDVLALARRERALVMIHAENADCIGWLTQKLELAGRTAPKYHVTARPQVVEREATHRAIALAELTEVPILIVHVSGSEAVEQKSGGHAAVACASTPRPARNTSFSRLTTSMPRASPAPNASAVRRRATEPARRRSGTPWPMALSRCSRPTTRRFATTTPRARWSEARRRASRTCRTAFLASRRGCRCCSRRASAKAG